VAAVVLLVDSELQEAAVWCLQQYCQMGFTNANFDLIFDRNKISENSLKIISVLGRKMKACRLIIAVFAQLFKPFYKGCPSYSNIRSILGDLLFVFLLLGTFM
jgi:hypothetical protein